MTRKVTSLLNSPIATALFRVMLSTAALMWAISAFAGKLWLDNRVDERIENNRDLREVIVKSDRTDKAVVDVAQAAKELTQAVKDLREANQKMEQRIDLNRDSNVNLGQQMAVVQTQIASIASKVDKIGDKLGVP